MLRRWFLIQIDLGSSASLHSYYAIQRSYYCMFLVKHPGDKRLSDNFGQWWPDWYKYSHESVSNDIVFGDRILFRLNATPNSAKYIQWADEFILRPASNILLGPFNSPIFIISQPHAE